MSQKRNKYGSAHRGNEENKLIKKKDCETKLKENIIRKLYDSFRDSFDLALIASVAHTCQWDYHRASEALLILSDRKSNQKNENKASVQKKGTKNKAMSLPGTLKQDKRKAEDDAHSAGLAHYSSTNSLSSGQVWQRHYKSKPQSPGLLTMIPPHSKEIVRLKNPESCRSLSKNQQFDSIKTTSTTVKKIQDLVQSNVKVLILMRGLPGSGKTHLAQVVVSVVTKNEFSQHILSTDDYFVMMGRGNYAYDYNQLAQAHNWNQKRVSEALKRGINPVIVDNTNTQAWEMQPYVVMAVEHNYLVEVLEPVTEWRNKEAELAKRNIHSVPREKIRQMSERFEPGWTGEKLLKSFGLKYKQSGCVNSTSEMKLPSDSLLAQHRQHGMIETPEKPKRKKNGIKKKDNHLTKDIELTEEKEKQLEELKKLFAEYGKTMDSVSKQKVLESGVPISEVVLRMRKLQGNVLPLPGSNVNSATIDSNNEVLNETASTKTEPDYSGLRKDSFSVFLEHDTISSSNPSEISECETDIDIEMSKWKDLKKYFGNAGVDDFIDDDDLLADYESGDGHNQISANSKFTKSQISSSQEELSIIDYCAGNTSLTCSEEDSHSSSSSEEQETQLLTLEESLREVLLGNICKTFDINSAISSNKEYEVSEDLRCEDEFAQNIFKKSFDDSLSHIEAIQSKNTIRIPQANESLLQMLAKEYSKNDENETEEAVSLTSATSSRETLRDLCNTYKRSPDLEEFPLPSIPSETSEISHNNENDFEITNFMAKENLNKSKERRNDADCQEINKPKCDLLEHITNSWEPNDSAVKQRKPRNIKKAEVLTTTDKSPEELLKSVELSWSSVPFTSSWEDVSKKALDSENVYLPKPQRKTFSKVDSATNTIPCDFELWKKNDEGLVKLNANSRNINENYKEPATPLSRVPDVLMLDKSSMTLDPEEMPPTEKDNALDTLCGMFPNTLRDNLSDILDKCNGNILWAVEVLLESPQQLGNALENVVSREYLPENSGIKKNDPNYTTLQSVLISDGKKTIKRRKDKKGATDELSLLLKKQIEESVQINEELYQDKTLFLKKLRHGEIEFGDGPLTSHPSLDTGNLETNKYKEADMESEEDEEETMQMKLDPEFFECLTRQFGSPGDKPLTLEAPVINIPISLAQQIYDCWVEKVNKELEEMQTTYDRMIKDDELLATALQEQEIEYRQPDLREIMDMELAMLLYKQNQVQLVEGNRETIATKLSKQLLFEAYPNLDKKMLLDLFESEGRSFQKTVDVLNAQENQSPTTVIAPEFLANHGKKLLELAKSDNLKKNIHEGKKPTIIVKQKNTSKELSDAKNILLVNPVVHTQKISLLHKQRNECCRLAQEAFRKKSFSVASYFSHLAALYKERIKNLSAEIISPAIFEDKSNKCLTQIDLHFLLVPEALQILDLFLDHHIKELRKKAKSSLCLNLITGRGHHSFNGKSKIKPAVMKRLEKRQIGFAMVNPGMLQVTVRKNDFLTEEM